MRFDKIEIVKVPDDWTAPDGTLRDSWRVVLDGEPWATYCYRWFADNTARCLLAEKRKAQKAGRS